MVTLSLHPPTRIIVLEGGKKAPQEEKLQRNQSDFTLSKIYGCNAFLPLPQSIGFF